MVEDQITNLYLNIPRGFVDLEAPNSFNANTNAKHDLWWSGLVGKDPTFSGAGDGDLSVFPPSSHENLVPAELGPVTPSTPSPLRETGPDMGGDSGICRTVPICWAESARVLCSRVWRMWASCGVVMWNRPVGKVAVVVLGWWFWVRLGRWRRRRREESVGRLLRIIRDKDERISQLLNQIAQMNEVLLARHR